MTAPNGVEKRLPTPFSLAADIERAVGLLSNGGVVVYPTETFYGLGVDATSATALERLGALKGRDRGKPVSVLVSSLEMLATLVTAIPPIAERWMSELWPGPLTLAFPARTGLSPVLVSGGSTIAARISSHPIARRLVERFGRPLSATSANPGGLPPAVEVAEARAYFGSRVDAYLDGGPSAGGVASTVVDCSVDPPRVVREGAVSVARLEEVAGMRLWAR